MMASIYKKGGGQMSEILKPHPDTTPQEMIADLMASLDVAFKNLRMEIKSVKEDIDTVRAEQYTLANEIKDMLTKDADEKTE